MNHIQPSILLTGGAGFLGGFVAERLCQSSRLTILDNLSTGSRSNLPKNRVRFVRTTVWTEKALDIVRMGRFDLIIHLAANGYIPASVTAPYADFDNNLVQPVKLLEALRLMKNPPKILFASTAAVHGPSGKVLSESDTRLIPVSPYGAGKLGLENYAHQYAVHYGLKTLCVRLFPMYGPRQHKQVVYDLLRKISDPGKTLEVHGSGHERRDLVYVEDAADALARLIRKAPFNGNIINICNGKGIPISLIANLLLKKMRSDKKVRYTQKLRPGDVDRMIGSTRRLARFGIKCKTTLDNGIDKTVVWFKKQAGATD